MGLAPHLRLGRRWTLVGGKGGVGKTTVAAALALELADGGESVTVLSTDPAHSLGDALGLPLGPEPRPVPLADRLHALEVDAEHERSSFLRDHGSSIAALLERGTYLDAEDIERVTGVTLPGVDELAALLRILRLTDVPDRRFIADTAPTGHTLRLLELPKEALRWCDALDAMEAKHAAVASAFAGAYRPDEVARFVDDLRRDLQRLIGILNDPDETTFVLVTTPQPVVLAESRRYAARIEELGVALGGIVVNRELAPPPAESLGPRVVHVPELEGTLTGLDGLRRFARSVQPTSPGVVENLPAVGSGIDVGGPLLPPLDRGLYFVAGKGGVGKSTVAAALAIRLADEGRRTLLLGIDPAGSLGEVLDEPVSPEARELSDPSRLTVRQLEASVAWARFRADYEGEVEVLFGALRSRHASATHDQDVLERLLDLAPPGLDELMALVEVMDTAEDSSYHALVVDTAPTGHFIRLLELPDAAIEWTHTLLRLLLKYREVIGLGDLGERVLKVARSLRAFQDRLRDPRRTAIVSVSLPEALGIPETERLLARTAERSLTTTLLLVNRAFDEGATTAGPPDRIGALLEIAGSTPVAGAPRLDASPTGVVALRAFAASWRGLKRVADSSGRPRPLADPTRGS